jgi:hypothetical protein
VASLSSGLTSCPATTHGCHAGTRLPGSKIGSSSQSRKEAGNEVELKKDEWNVLVELIRTGKLTCLSGVARFLFRTASV